MLLLRILTMRGSHVASMVKFSPVVYCISSVIRWGFYIPEQLQRSRSGPSCSNLTTSFVNDSLKFTSSDMQICWNFLLKKIWVAFAVQCKSYSIFSAKNIRILYMESANTVNELTLNELVKLTTLWTTGPCLIRSSWSLGLFWMRKLHFIVELHKTDSYVCHNFGGISPRLIIK